MSTERLTSEVLQLDPKSRAVLAEAIWESLEDPFFLSVEMSDQAAIQLAHDRAQEMEVEHGIRRALMKKFPFVVYCRIVNDDLLRVTVVKHQRSHPRFGIKRM